MVGVEVKLAEGARGREAIGPALPGFVEENIDQADARFGHRASQAAAATFGLQRVPDDGGAERFDQPVHGRRVVLVVERRIGADELAAVIGGDLQSLERLAHLLLDGFQADVVDQHVQRMEHGSVAAVAQPDCPERAINGVLHRGVVVEIMFGLVQHQVAGGAGGHDGTITLLLRQGQVAGRQHACLSLVHCHVSGRAAAVPVFDLLQFNAEVLHHRQQRFFVGAAQPF